MKIKKILINFICTILAFILISAWIFCTQSGFKFAIFTANLFIPGKITVISAKGSIAKGLNLKNIVYTNKNVVTIDKVNLNLDFSKIISEKEITIKNLGIKNLKGINLEDNSQSQFFSAENLQIKAKVQKTNNYILLDINKVTGIYNKNKIDAKIHLLYKNGVLSPYKSNCINLGKNYAKINIENNKKISWQIDIFNLKDFYPTISGKIISSGVIGGLQPKDKVQAKISTEKLSINDQSLKKLNLTIDGNIKNHIIDIKANNSSKINAKIIGNFENKEWKATIQKIKLRDLEFGSWANKDASTVKINKNAIEIKNFNIVPQETNSTIIKANIIHDIKADKLNSEFNLIDDNNDFIIAKINIKNLKAKKASARLISGSINGRVSNLNLVSQFLPEVNNISGALELNGTISGTTSKPIFQSLARGSNISFAIPDINAKVNSLNFKIKGDKTGKFILDGNAIETESNNIINLSGFAKPFSKDLEHIINIKADRIKAINLDDVKATLSADINLKFAKNRLLIEGIANINEANINLESNLFSSSHISSDLKYIEGNNIVKEEVFKVIPNLKIGIENQTFVHGFDLKSYVSGSLKISENQDKLVGDGKITLKKGYYKIASDTFKIRKGRLDYPPGTLLINPQLSIKMYKKASKIKSKIEKIDQETIGIYIGGTLKNPKIETYSDKNKNKNFIRSMGINNQRDHGKKISEAINMSGSDFTNKIKEISGLDEINLDSLQSHTYDTSNNKKSENTVIVLGKNLNSKIYLQYINSINSDKSTSKNLQKAKVNLKLSKHLNLSIEHGNDGSGADLGFLVEK